MHYLEEINKYHPTNQQEREDLIVIKDFVSVYGISALFRTSKIAHFSASAWIANQDRTKVLMCFHNIYKNWGWLGGHVDGEQDFLEVAIKEAKEESGLKNVTPLVDTAISVEILTVPYHLKKGQFVGSHLHMNFTYLLQADDKENLVIKPDENSGLRWIDIEEAPKITQEECMRPIYEKLNFVLKKCEY